MNWIPLNNKTHFSLQRGFSKPDKLISKCKEFGYDACAITDINTISGAVAFFKDCKKQGIKPIIGCTFEFENGKMKTLLAKNKEGWYSLIDLVSKKNSYSDDVVYKLIDSISDENLISTDSIKQKPVYYVEPCEAELHRILLCSGMKTNMSKVTNKLDDNKKLKKFFNSDNFYLPSPERVRELYTAEEISWSADIAAECEEYEILGQPMLPEFDCPDDYTEDDYLKQLCRDGWRELLAVTGKVNDEDKKQEYLDRIKTEMDVIFDANLSGYFLIVQDIVNYVRSRDWLPGPGRGSAAGCLISYLIGITEIDPIEYDLIFERFYNAGRNTDGHVSLPDIDLDVPAEKRDEVIGYIKSKYGEDNVSQMLTFNKLQGKAALKEIMRINSNVSFGEMNDITKNIPNEADVSDLMEQSGQKSLIKWTLLYQPEILDRWCKVNSEDDLIGPLASVFQQAIDIEGTIKSQGKHAAGVIISSKKLREVCPMVQDRSKNLIAGFEMGDLEDQGHVKFDILGIDLLSKIMEIKE
jgi:DNA polymerase-3 subunit alpha|tara:strand:- start:10555 stop:12126 length:1572 start_codon:yes stop_codon:yes gene_type:complete